MRRFVSECLRAVVSSFWGSARGLPYHTPHVDRNTYVTPIVGLDKKQSGVFCDAERKTFKISCCFSVSQTMSPAAEPLSRR